ncbi:MAG: hypothetical protein A3G71_00640 [Gammaproteobacteria bacterium RIFCSPLOWO2_12_FULL_38_14]|nr:MAG: hypothetical protein A3G71_00640 [Gammaproteobacteria bacterium RIFCSPLOWO2_12_FULL_38_14]
MKTLREELETKLVKAVYDRLRESLKKRNELDAMMTAVSETKPDQEAHDQALKNYREFIGKLSIMIDHAEPYSEIIKLTESYNNETVYSAETVPWIPVVFSLLGSFAMLNLHEKKDRWEAVHELLSARFNLVRGVYPGLESLVGDLKKNLYGDLRKTCEDAVKHPEKYSQEESLVEKLKVKIGKQAASSSEDWDDPFSQLAAGRHKKTEVAAAPQGSLSAIPLKSVAAAPKKISADLLQFDKDERLTVGVAAGGRKEEASAGEVLQKVGGFILRNKSQEIPLYLASLDRQHNKEIIRQLLLNRHEQFHKKEESDDGGLCIKTLMYLMLDLSTKRQGVGGSTVVIEEFMESTSRWEWDKKFKLVTNLSDEMKRELSDSREQKVKQMFEVLLKALKAYELVVQVKRDMPKK